VVVHRRAKAWAALADLADVSPLDVVSSAVLVHESRDILRFAPPISGVADAQMSAWGRCGLRSRNK
jgi:hypothetical protein